MIRNSILSIATGAVALGYATVSVEAGSRLFGIDSNASQVVEISYATGVELNRFDLPEASSLGPDGLAFDGTSLFFGSGPRFGGGGVLYELNPDTGTVLDADSFASLGLSDAIDGLTFFDGRVVASDTITSEVFFVDPATDTIERSFVAPVSLRGGLASAEPRGTLFANNFLGSGNPIFELDPATGLVVNEIPSGADVPGTNINGLAYTGGHLLGGRQNGVIARFDPDTGALVATIQLDDIDFTALAAFVPEPTGAGSVAGFVAVLAAMFRPSRRAS